MPAPSPPVPPLLRSPSPAAKALLAQLGGILAAFALGRAGLLPAGIWPLAGVQALAATAAAAALKSDRWWLPIHLAFVPLLVAGQRLGLPPLAWLVAFGALLAFYWTSFRTRAPLFLTNRRTVPRVAELLPAGKPLEVLDIGSGTGSLVRPLARLRPDCAFCGIETAPGPWLLGRLLGRGIPNLRWLRGDLFAIPWGGYDVVYAFLSPAPMAAVWDKASRELRPGALLVSNSFAVPQRAADFVVEVGDRRGTRLYGYRITARQAAN